MGITLCSGCSQHHILNRLNTANAPRIRVASNCRFPGSSITCQPFPGRLHMLDGAVHVVHFAVIALDFASKIPFLA